MVKDSPSTSTYNKNSAAEILLGYEIFKHLRAIDPDPDSIRIKDALADAREAIKEVRNRTHVGSWRNLADAWLRPLAKQVATEWDLDLGLMLEIAILVFTKNVGRVGIEVLREHARSKPSGQKLPKNSAKPSVPQPVIDLASTTTTTSTSQIGGAA